MMLLSSLIGPAKPPVATREDVDSAGGILIVTFVPLSNGGLQREDTIQLQIGERCLVCLEDFEEGNQVRQLLKCQHVFHRDCIDEVCLKSRIFFKRG